LFNSQRPQVIVPAGVWQASKLAFNGTHALVGTTMSPGFDFADYEHGNIEYLADRYPSSRTLILSLAKHNAD
jgi:predicted cupin superfamily sugar epimerase